MPVVQFTFPTLAAAKRENNGRAVSTKNSKMPGSTFATDPFVCHTGAKLRDVPNSTCSRCYAIRLAKYRANVADGYSANQIGLDRAAALPRGAERARWIAAMADQIERAAVKTGKPYHRWFDAGDLSSSNQLRLITAVARATPRIYHWLPTRELAYVRGVLLPSNLVVRISSTMIGDAPRKAPRNTSTVHRKNADHAGLECRAYTRGGQCGDCRACWDPTVANVSYPLH